MKGPTGRRLSNKHGPAFCKWGAWGMGGDRAGRVIGGRHGPLNNAALPRAFLSLPERERHLSFLDPFPFAGVYFPWTKKTRRGDKGGEVMETGESGAPRKERHNPNDI